MGVCVVMGRGVYLLCLLMRTSRGLTLDGLTGRPTGFGSVIDLSHFVMSAAPWLLLGPASAAVER